MEVPAALLAAKQIAATLTAAVGECANGAPASLLYAPLVAWLRFDQFNALISILVRNKLIRREATRFTPSRGRSEQ